jgi:hypothetical protein
MALGGCGTPLRGSGKDQTIWKLEWTYTDGSGAVSLDTAQSDRRPDVATPVADSGSAGITNITFPKCDRFWILSKNLEPATEGTGTNYRIHEVTDKSASAGTCKVRFFDVLGDGTPSPTEPESGSRYQLILLLERS